MCWRRKRGEESTLTTADAVTPELSPSAGEQLPDNLNSDRRTKEEGRGCLAAPMGSTRPQPACHEMCSLFPPFDPARRRSAARDWASDSNASFVGAYLFVSSTVRSSAKATPSPPSVSASPVCPDRDCGTCALCT
ncbi:hypothetical protein BaRGS_00002608, partial [Batillaria attramentaria]